MKKNLLRVLFVAFAIGMLTGFSSCASKKRVIKQRTITTNTYLNDKDEPLSEWISCTACDGKGHCMRCAGTGKVNGQKCVTCDGRGLCKVCNGQGGYRK